MDETVFRYIAWVPAILGLIAVWILIGSVGARIARRHASTRSKRECPECQGKLDAVRPGIHNRMAGVFFLVDITRYACRQCGYRLSMWQA